MSDFWDQLMRILSSVETDDTRESLHLLMSHAGLQLFYDPPNGLELLKVAITKW